MGKASTGLSGFFWLVRNSGLRQTLSAIHAQLSRLEIQLGVDNAGALETGDVLPQQRLVLGPIPALDLRRFEKQVYSQNGEDGIIEEIFSRVGTTNKHFIEFGIYDEQGNCTRLALQQQWSGLLIEMDPKAVKLLEKIFASNQGVKILNSKVTAANIESLFQTAAVPAEPDLLSIDIDSNDYWVWQAITRYKPRVVIVEYNAAYPPPRRWVMVQNDNHMWNKTNYYGASLESLHRLGREKGYRLVGTDSHGVNAFFVRNDVFDAHRDRFVDEVSAYHYSPPRFGPHLGGHPPGKGPYVEI